MHNAREHVTYTDWLIKLTKDTETNRQNDVQMANRRSD